MEKVQNPVILINQTVYWIQGSPFMDYQKFFRLKVNNIRGTVDGHMRNSIYGAM
jgi:hypothetical protein